MAWIDRQFPNQKTINRTKTYRKWQKLQDARIRRIQKIRRLTDRWNASPKMDDGLLLVSVWVITHIEMYEAELPKISYREDRAFDRWSKAVDNYRRKWAKANNRTDLIESVNLINNVHRAIFS